MQEPRGKLREDQKVRPEQRECYLSWIQYLAAKVITTGKVPRHVAFIMDGNRRYANKKNLKTTTDGHTSGFDKLNQALYWCLEFGVKEVTIYAFSIENFKRSNLEVDSLLEFAKEKFFQIMEHKEQLEKQGICLRMIGNWRKLPPDFQKSMADTMLLTRNNNKLFLNIAFAYTSRDEITESIKAVVDGVRRDELNPNDISEALIRRCMYSGKSTDPDLLLRTSGETRLSDFLLWQVSATVIYFTDTLWPELTFWHILAGIFQYQRSFQKMKKVKKTLEQFSVLTADDLNNKQPTQLKDTQKDTNQHETNTNTKLNNCFTKFLENFDKRQYDQLVELQNLPDALLQQNNKQKMQ